MLPMVLAGTVLALVFLGSLAAIAIEVRKVCADD